MTEATLQVDTNSQNISSKSTESRLRLWPGIVIVVAMWLAWVWSSVGEKAPHKFFFGLIVAPAVTALLLNFWWLAASRLRWVDRLFFPAAFFGIAAATASIAGKDFPPMALILYALPAVTTLWVAWLIVSRRLSWSTRRTGLLFLFLLSGCYFSILRVDGMDGNFAATFNWRWTPTSEAKLLSELKKQEQSRSTEPADLLTSTSLATKTVDSLTEPMTVQAGDWPSFRGPARDGRLTGVSIRTDWDKSPPRELWRHRVGPGWSSCSVIGDRLFTQEQRGNEEFVVCYSASTGAEVWAHRDSTRFEEVVAGPGPRGTPTFHEGRIFALGANGRLNCLDAATGHPIWSVDIVESTKAKVPQWGFSSSPLVFHGLVTVFAGGADGKSVVAYRVDSGELAWATGEGSQSYCSAHAATFDGIDQLLITTEVGMAAYEPEQGTLLWEHRWPVQQARVVQPAILSETDVLLGTGMSGGTRRISIQHDGETWSTKELWTTRVIKPYYNDLVVSEDHFYGFDGNIFMCISLTDGKMKWRARGYGNGQVLLLADDRLLIIMTEQGEVALVEAKPGQHQELAKFKAIEGKTWNHPVIAHNRLFVRNAEEMACFELSTTSNPPEIKVGESN